MFCSPTCLPCPVPGGVSWAQLGAWAQWEGVVAPLSSSPHKEPQLSLVAVKQKQGSKAGPGLRVPQVTLQTVGAGCSGPFAWGYLWWGRGCQARLIESLGSALGQVRGLYSPCPALRWGMWGRVSFPRTASLSAPISITHAHNCLKARMQVHTQTPGTHTCTHMQTCAHMDMHSHGQGLCTQ